MKNLFIKKGLFLLLIALGVTACNEDIHNFTKTTESEASNSIYIASDDALFTYPMFGNLEGELITEVDTILAKFPISLAEPSENDVIVTLEMDNDLVDIYNMQHGTHYTIVTPQYVELSNDGVITIPAGQTVSNDSISVAYTRPVSSLNTIGGYLIPIRIASYKGTDVKINYDERHCYLAVDVIHENEVYFDATEIFSSMNAIEQDLNTVSFALKSRYVIQGQEDAKVQIAVNNDLIAAFNAEQGTDYQPIPSGLTTSYEVTMPNGSSDPMTFTLEYTGDPSTLDDAYDYVIPLEITTVAGDAAINVLENDKVFYLIVSVFAAPDPTTSTVVSSDVEIGGTIVTDKSKYGLTSMPLYIDGTTPSGTTNFSPSLGANTVPSPGSGLGFPCEAGSRYIIGRSPMPGMLPGGMANKLNMTIDLGAEYENITGLQLRNTQADGYVGNVSALEVGFVNEKMIELGMSSVTAGSIETPAYQKTIYIKFKQPVKARYIMLNNIATSSIGNQGVGFDLDNFEIYIQP